MTGKDRETSKSNARQDPADPVRRKLLRIGVYTAPAIIGTLFISREAAAQTSCGPQSCGVCPPEEGPCGPLSCGPES